MEVFSILFPVAILAFLALLVALSVFMISRWRAGTPFGISFRTIALAYCYLMSAVSLLVLVIGLSMGVKAGLSDVLGRGFSYYVAPEMRMMPVPEDKADPSAPRNREMQPIPPEEQEQNARRVERQYKEDLIASITTVVVGGVVWAVHTYGRRRLQAEDALDDFLSKSYATTMLVIFGLVGMVGLTMGINELLRYYLIEPDQFSRRQSPGDAVSTALVFVPIWFYYVLTTLKRGRAEASTESAESM